MLDQFSPNFSDYSQPSKRIEEYGRFQQHLVLLEDVGRIDSYHRAISSVQPGEVVVDVGAGTGILGMMALKQGFGHAYLIEPSRKMGTYARHLAAINGLSEKVTIIESTLETMDMSKLPKSIDLIVTETISSLLFGFGSWDVLPLLIERSNGVQSVIPNSGSLYVAPSALDLSTRGPSVDGLAKLKEAGLEVDLYQRTFRSGGNIYQKKPIVQSIANGNLKPFKIAKFNFTHSDPISLSGAILEFSESTTIVGLVCFWDLQLVGGDNPIKMGNLDPRVTSWYPYFVPFKNPIQVQKGMKMPISLQLIALDTPYKYAFQFISEKIELTHVLYW